MAFVESLDAPELTADDRHHLARVLRVREGDPMVVCDASGSWRRAIFAPVLGVDGPCEFVPAPSPALTVAFALIKGDRPELVVQKLTEFGIDRIVPFVADHGVVRWDEGRAAKQTARFERIAREAAMQCRRTRLPEIAAVGSFDDVVAASSGAVLMADADAPRLAAERVSGPEGVAGVTVLIGPEGGWSEAERARGLDTVRIGDHVLRAETASIAAATLLTAFRVG